MNTNIFRHIFTSLETPPVSLVDILGDCCLLNVAHVCVANTVQFENNLDLWFSFCLFTAIQKMHSFEFQVYSFLVLVCIIYHDIIPLLPLRSSNGSPIMNGRWVPNREKYLSLSRGGWGKVKRKGMDKKQEHKITSPVYFMPIHWQILDSAEKCFHLWDQSCNYFLNLMSTSLPSLLALGFRQNKTSFVLCSWKI